MHFNLKPSLAVPYFTLSWRFVARWKPERSRSSFQGHLNTVSYIQSQNDVNASMFSSQQNDLYSQVGSKYFNNFHWQRQWMFPHDLLDISGGWERDETSRRRNTIKYMCSHPHFSPPVYRQVLLTLQFWCCILHICITCLAKNGTTLYLSWLRDPVLATSEYQTTLFFMWYQELHTMSAYPTHCSDR